MARQAEFAMHTRSCLLLAALIGGSASLSAQLRVQVGGGVTASTMLVTDSILEPIRVRPALAPTLMVSLDGALDSVYRVGISVTVGSSMLRSHTPTATTDIVSLTVWQPAVRLGRYWGPLDVGLRAGLQVYRASRPVGIFRDGGKVTPTVGADLALRGPRIVGAQFGMAADWTLSRFNTTTLSLSGFSGEQTVQRVALRVTIAGGPGAH